MSSWIRRFGCGASVIATLVAYGCSSNPPSPASATDPMGSGATLTGACPQDGATRSCHGLQSETNGIIDCYQGTQSCSGGMWSACGGSTMTHTVLPKPAAASQASQARGGGLSTASLGPPSTMGPPCSLDPCNPYCWGFNEVPAGGITIPVPGGGALGSSGDFDDLPGGWGVEEDPCNVGHRDMPAGGSDHTDCSYDQCCAVDGADCVPWPTAPSTGDCTICTGVDFTLAIGCDNGDVHFPVCNRGNTAATSGTVRLGIDDDPPGGEHACSPQDSESRGYCDINLATLPIAAGQCVDIDVTAPPAGVTCTGIDTSGNVSGYINEGGSPIGECDPCNNWAAMVHDSCAPYNVPPPMPLVVQETYATTGCDTANGYRPQWGFFAYDVTNEPGTNVTFRVQTGPTVTGPWTPTTPVTSVYGRKIAAPGAILTDPDVCSMAGPPPCPKSLYNTLLPYNAQLYPVLDLTMILNPSGFNVPTVNSWQITYSCVPLE